MPAISQYADQAARAVSAYRSGTNSHWNDSYLNMGAQLMQQQMENDQQMELWNLMNEYNSPKSQMERFAEAGLNPNLIYHQGSNGNASSTAGYSHANYTLTPQQDRYRQIQEVGYLVNMFSDLMKNVASLWDTGYNLQLKRNQLVQSDFDTAALTHTFGAGGGTGINMVGLDQTLNPFSSKFDPLAFVTFQKNGNLPSFLNQFMTGEVNRSYTGARLDYQKYYNENLLPKFNEYQQGKIDLQEIEKELQNYQKTSLDMLPPEIRGIVQPLVDYLSPFLKFIFKSTTRR